jgi:hypothetical protein
MNPTAQINGKATFATSPAGNYFCALFNDDDHVSFRPTETWNEVGADGRPKKKSRVVYKEAKAVNAKTLYFVRRRLLDVCQRERANDFVGVCPRVGLKHEKAWQIRVVRCLWSDVDNCTPAEAIERCKKAGVLRPSIIVNSGNGVHLYWLLAEPYLIDDVGDPPAVEVEWIDQGEGQKKKKREYYLDEVGDRHYLPDDAPDLSQKALYVQDVIAGIASVIGGDHTHDLARLLRVPDTFNRKDERNGRAPVKCELVELDADRRYSIEHFAKWADKAPTKKEREQVAAIPLPSPRKITAGKRDKLNELITACAVAEVGARSERDWALICHCIRHGIPRHELWSMVADVGKFAERGEAYFIGRWTKAEGTVRQEFFDKAKKQSRPKAPATNGTPRNSLVSPPSSVFLPDGRTDLANAKRFVSHHARTVRWCQQWNTWLVWDGQRWAREKKCEVTAKAKTVFRSLWAEIGVPTDE